MRTPRGKVYWAEETYQSQRQGQAWGMGRRAREQSGWKRGQEGETIWRCSQRKKMTSVVT